MWSEKIMVCKGKTVGRKFSVVLVLSRPPAELCVCPRFTRGVPEVSIALERMNYVVHFIKNSPKKLGRFNNIVQQLETGDIPHRHDNVLRPICPTR